MDKSIIIFIIAVFLAGKGFSQNLDFKSVDKKSYELFESQNWNELVTYGKLANKNGFNYYNLNYRIAIAYYELKNYRKAVLFFENLYKGDTSNDLLKEYLYYSYLFSGRSADAKLISYSFGEKLKNKIGISDEIYQAQTVNAEVKFNSFSDYSIDYSPIDIINKKQRKELSYYNITLNQNIGKRINLNTGVTYLDALNNNIDTEVSNQPFNSRLKQFQLYISSGIAITSGLQLKGSYHFIYYRENITGNQFQEPPNKITSTTHAGMIKLTKNLKNTDLDLSFEFSNFNSKTQATPAFSCLYYPLGNNHLYLYNKLGFQFQTDDLETISTPYFTQKLGIKLYDHLWLEPFWFIGGVSNFTDSDLFVIYNSNDVINNWFGAQVHVPLVKNKIKLYFIYQQYNLSNTYQFYLSDKKIDYSVKTFLGGISWILN